MLNVHWMKSKISFSFNVTNWQNNNSWCKEISQILPETLFTGAKFKIFDPEFHQRRHFHCDFQPHSWPNLLSDWSILYKLCQGIFLSNMNRKKALNYTTIIFNNLCLKIVCFDQIICFLISPLVTTGQNVPGKNQEFLLVISSCLCTYRKNLRIGLSICFQQQKIEHLYHIYNFFKFWKNLNFSA